MKLTKIADNSFDEIRTGLSGPLQEVYEAWMAHGPATTRRLARAGRIRLLNVRPRTSELVSIGLVQLTAHHRGEGVYRARRQEEWERWAERQNVTKGDKAR